MSKQTLTPLIREFYPYAKKRLGFKEDCRVGYKHDPENASEPLGKTAYYDPAEKKITLFITERHPKDVMRSFSHELVHHAQNLRGEFNNVGDMGEGYAQANKHLREMEREAYEQGNLIFRDWEDQRKIAMQESIYSMEHENMSVKEAFWKDQRLPKVTEHLMERFGYKPKLDVDNQLVESLHKQDPNAVPPPPSAAPVDEEVDEELYRGASPTKDPPWARRRQDRKEGEPLTNPPAAAKGSKERPYMLTKKKVREAIAQAVRSYLPQLQEGKITKDQVIAEVKRRLAK